MSEISEILNQIRDELKELRLLYKELVEKLIPEEEPEPDERKVIEEDDGLVSEEELFQALKKGKWLSYPSRFPFIIFRIISKNMSQYHIKDKILPPAPSFIRS